MGAPPGGGAPEGPQSRAAGRRRPQAAARTRGIASSRAGTRLTFGPGNTGTRSHPSLRSGAAGMSALPDLLSLLSAWTPTQVQPAHRVHRSAGDSPHSHPRRSRKATAPRLRTARVYATVRLRRRRACADPGVCLLDPGCGLILGCSSSDPAHWLRGGAWARSAADWTAHEQLGSRGPMEGTAGTHIGTAEGCGL